MVRGGGVKEEDGGRGGGVKEEDGGRGGGVKEEDGGRGGGVKEEDGGRGGGVKEEDEEVITNCFHRNMLALYMTVQEVKVSIYGSELPAGVR